MKRALFLMILSCLVVSLVTAQKPAKVAPKNYKVSVADMRGSVSPDGRFLSYVDWSTGDLAVRDLGSGESRNLTNEGSWSEPRQAAKTGQATAGTPGGSPTATGPVAVEWRFSEPQPDWKPAVPLPGSKTVDLERTSDTLRVTLSEGSRISARTRRLKWSVTVSG